MAKAEFGSTLPWTRLLPGRLWQAHHCQSAWIHEGRSESATHPKLAPRTEHDLQTSEESAAAQVRLACGRPGESAALRYAIWALVSVEALLPD